MKKYIYSLLILFAVLVSGRTYGQAKKYPVFEHFTQASCPPCALQNPFFQELYYSNEGKVHHIAYHTSWPGIDEMYTFNAAQSDAMVDYYSVTGVPSMFMDGAGVGSPAAVTQVMIDDQIAMTSPIRILASEETSGSTRDVTIEIETMGTVPAGSYVLKVAVVEKEITYATPPGTNGETFFPNVFREMLPNTTGDAFVAAGMGGSVTFEYSYTLDDEWDAEQIYVIAFVQNTATGEVLNSGASFDIPDIDAVVSSDIIDNNAAGVSTSFTGNISNTYSDDAELLITLYSDAPGDWTASFDYDGNTYTSSTTTTVGVGESNDITLNVVPGATADVAHYTIAISSAAAPPTAFALKLEYYVISGITDLVLNNHSGFGNELNSPNLYNWAPMYTDGLAAAGSTTHDELHHTILFSSPDPLGMLEGVDNIYFNCGWTFPTVTDDVALLFQDFMDAGGNLMIAGQDIGWEINDAASEYGTETNQSFYENYLHAGFISDNSNEDNITGVLEDEWFNEVGESDLDAVYDEFFGDAYFPDRIEAADEFAFPVLYYDGNDANIGGIRSETANYRTVYLGMGLEMIQNTPVRNAVMDATYQYFKGQVDGIEFDQIMLGLLGGAYPNPTASATNISITNADKNYTIRVTDITGKIVAEDKIAAGTTNYVLNTDAMESGMYFYFLTDGMNTTQTEKLNVIK